MRAFVSTRILFLSLMKGNAPPALRPAIFPVGYVRYQRTAAQAASFACRKRGGHAVRLQFGPISAMITAEIIKKEGKAKTAKITA